MQNGHAQSVPITAVILAAGESSRMKQLKMLMPIGDKPMLEKVINGVLAFPFSKILCVIGRDADQIRQTIQVDDPRFEWIYNADYAKGQSTSLKLGAHSVRDGEQGMMVFLGDQPFMQPATIQQVLDKASETSDQSGKRVIQPTYDGIQAHPVFISMEMFKHIDELDGDIGARVLFGHAEDHIMLPAEDKGALIDIDTPEEYEQYKNGI